MPTNRLELVEALDQFGFGDWKRLAVELSKASGARLDPVQVVKGILQNRLKITIEIARRLGNLESADVPAGRRNPHDYFQNRVGLAVTPSFVSIMLRAATRRATAIDEDVVGYADLVHRANDAEIGNELPDRYVFGHIDDFLILLSVLIEEQKDGGEGALRNDGGANIFYVNVGGETVAVAVQYNDRRGWQCHALHARATRWSKGSRLFSAIALVEE